MGLTKFEGGLLQKYYNMFQVKLPTNQILQLYKRITSVIMFTQFTKKYKDTQRYNKM